MIIIESFHSISFTVSDIEKSIAFYRDIFGFDIVERHSGSSEAVMQVGDILLRLIEDSSVSEPLRDEDYVAFSIDDDDFDEALDQIDENNITVISGPDSLRSGRKIIITDPDKNKIALISAVN